MKKKQAALWFVFVGLVLIIVSLRVCHIEGGSMKPTMHSGEMWISEILTYRFVAPKRGQIAVIREDNGTNTLIAKRIAGVPGDTIKYTSRYITINSVKKEFPQENPKIFTKRPVHITLEEHQYFVIGDNWRTSMDSRHNLGPVKEQAIIGHVIAKIPFIRVYAKECEEE